MSDMQSSQVAPVEAKPPQAAWKKYLSIATFVFLLAAIALKWVGIYAASGELPGCASDGAKDGLSNIFKTAKVNFSRYVEIKTLTTSKEEITCNAVLAKSAGGTADIDYRIFYEDKEPRVTVTRAEDKP